MTDYSFYPLSKNDVDAIAELEKILFSDGWGSTAISSCIGRSDCIFITAKKSGELCAYVCAELAADCAYISKVACAPNHRRKGFASALLTELEAQCKNAGVTELSLDVRASNTAARKLYESAGFILAGIRPRGYEHPTEDAAVYVKSLMT